MLTSRLFRYSTAMPLSTTPWRIGTATKRTTPGRKNPGSSTPTLSAGFAETPKLALPAHAYVHGWPTTVLARPTPIRVRSLARGAILPGPDLTRCGNGRNTALYQTCVRRRLGTGL